MTLRDAVLAAIDALESCRVPYLLVGSFSSNAYGVVRSTQDVDLVIQLGDTSIMDIARRLPAQFRVDPQLGFETVTLTKRYVATVADTGFKIEFFLLGKEPHDLERFRRRRVVDYLGRKIALPTVEDVIITKLRWALLGDRSKDRDDVRDVIAVQNFEGRIDWDYVHAWCERHGTRALLDEIRASIPPI